ncbi:MAG TPA: hypothetical protein VGB95_06375 [Chitinophagales bacterium]
MAINRDTNKKTALKSAVFLLLFSSNYYSLSLKRISRNISIRLFPKAPANSKIINHNTTFVEGELFPFNISVKVKRQMINTLINNNLPYSNFLFAYSTTIVIDLVIQK